MSHHRCCDCGSANGDPCSCVEIDWDAILLAAGGIDPSVYGAGVAEYGDEVVIKVKGLGILEDSRRIAFVGMLNTGCLDDTSKCDRGAGEISTRQVIISSFWSGQVRFARTGANGAFEEISGSGFASGTHSGQRSASVARASVCDTPGASYSEANTTSCEGEDSFSYSIAEPWIDGSVVSSCLEQALFPALLPGALGSCSPAGTGIDTALNTVRGPWSVPNGQVVASCVNPGGSNYDNLNETFSGGFRGACRVWRVERRTPYNGIIIEGETLSEFDGGNNLITCSRESLAAGTTIQYPTSLREVYRRKVVNVIAYQLNNIIPCGESPDPFPAVTLTPCVGGPAIYLSSEIQALTTGEAVKIDGVCHEVGAAVDIDDLNDLVLDAPEIYPSCAWCRNEYVLLAKCGGLQVGYALVSEVLDHAAAIGATVAVGSVLEVGDGADAGGAVDCWEITGLSNSSAGDPVLGAGISFEEIHASCAACTGAERPAGDGGDGGAGGEARVARTVEVAAKGPSTTVQSSGTKRARSRLVLAPEVPADELAERRFECFGDGVDAGCEFVERDEAGRAYCGQCGCGRKVTLEERIERPGWACPVGRYAQVTVGRT